MNNLPENANKHDNNLYPYHKTIAIVLIMLFSFLAGFHDNSMLYILLSMGILLILFPAFVYKLTLNWPYNLFMIVAVTGFAWYKIINTESIQYFFSYQQFFIIAALVVFGLLCLVILYRKPFDNVFNNNLSPENKDIALIKPLIFKLSIATYLLLSLLFVYHLNYTEYNSLYPLFWLLLMIAGAATFIYIDFRNDVEILKYSKKSLIEYGIMLLVSIILFLYYTHDLNLWLYLDIPDEHMFYRMAAKTAAGAGPENIFSLFGVYGDNPVLPIYVNAFFMKIFGLGNWGWKAAYASSAIITLWGLYYISKTLIDRQFAIIATAMLAFSHYFIVFSIHATKQMAFASSVIVLTAALIITGLKKNSLFWLYIAGVMCGLSFYFLYIARVSLPILLLTIILFIPFKKLHRYILPVFLGFLPLIQIHSKVYDFFDLSFKRTVFFQGNVADHGVSIYSDLEAYLKVLLESIFNNLLNPLRSIFVNNDYSHFVTGPLLDSITASMFIVGLFFLIYLAIRKNRNAILILAYFTVMYIVTAGLTMHVKSIFDSPSITRLYFLLPFAALVSATGLRFISEAIFKSKDAKITFVIMIIVSVLISNIFIKDYYNKHIHYKKEQSQLLLSVIQSYPEAKEFIYFCDDSYKIYYSRLNETIPRFKEFQDINFKFVIADKIKNKTVLLKKLDPGNNAILLFKNPSDIRHFINIQKLHKNYRLKIAGGATDPEYFSITVYIPAKYHHKSDKSVLIR